MTLHDEISKAIGAHGIWKMRLRTAIASGTADTDPHEVAKDNACAFGQWLYGPALPETVRASADYENVCALHARFHRCAATVLDCLSHGDIAHARALMNGEYLDVSGALNSAMVKWKDRVH